MNSFYLDRREKVRSSLHQLQYPGLLITHPLHVHYLTGFTGDSTFALITPSRFIVLSDERYRLQLQDECPQEELAIRGADRNTYQLAAELINQLKLSAVGIEARHLSVYLFEYLQGLISSSLIPTNNILENLRAVKDAFEVEQIRQAVRQAERAHTMFCAMLSPELTERQMVVDMESYLRRAGASGPSFPIIAEVGEHSAYPHATVSDRKLAHEPFMLLDWGALNGFYQSDLTRMIRSHFVDRSGPQRQQIEKVENAIRKLYINLNRVRAIALEKMRPGTPVKEIDIAVRASFAEAGVNELFTHGLGHGIGLETHESPQIRSNSDEVLQVGNVVTLEPGLYQPGLGGVRIEDDILITENGPELLSHLPTDWDELLI